MGKDYNALDRLEQGMPASWYYDPEHYQRELDAIWMKSWLFVCPGPALKEVGAYRTFEIGDQNLWVVRRENGELAAYHNNCRHRGSILLTESAGKFSSDSVSCPYHRWRYALDDGSLIATSSFCEPEGFDKSDRGLFRVAVREWNGLVFLNLDPSAEWNPTSYFRSDWAQLEKFRIADLVVGHRWERIVACNWKTFWDNFNECLHCPGVHRELVKMVPIYKRGLLEPQDHPDWRDHIDDPDPAYQGGVREGVETFSMDGSAQGYALAEGLSEEDLKRGVTYVDSVPSIYIGAHADHVRTVRILPLGPESMQLSVEWLFHAEALEDPNYDMANVTDFAQMVIEEDGVASELNQRGMHAAPMQHGVLMPEEYELKNFKEWVENTLDRS